MIKNQTSADKELSCGMTLRDLWENSPNAINKPLAHIGGGLSVSRANAGEPVRGKVALRRFAESDERKCDLGGGT